MKNRTGKNSLYWSLLRITLIPIIVLVLMITFLCARSLAGSIGQEAKKGLRNLCSTILMMYDDLYPGDYSVTETEGTLCLLKGTHKISGNFSIIDSMKENTDVDVTFFYQDMRMLTTIVDAQGERVIGTRSSEAVAKDVLEGGREAFYPSVLIEQKPYFAYYAPLFNSDGSCVGMIFVGKPSEYVDGLVGKAVMPIVILAIVAILSAGLLTMRFSRQLIGAIWKVEEFLEIITNGNLHAEPDYDVLKRNDELGGMGRHAVRMQKSLRELVEQDILTKLYNRRSGEKIFRQVQDKYRKSGAPFCIALGDVDHFKQVNDTFGHECGDAVLICLADRLKTHMSGRGAAIRWGGEEFLLVFQDCHLKDAVKCVEGMMQDIRNARIDYRGQEPIHITMTFGIVEGSEDNIEHIIREADLKLYAGKNSGRDQIVV